MGRPSNDSRERAAEAEIDVQFDAYVKAVKHEINLHRERYGRSFRPQSHIIADLNEAGGHRDRVHRLLALAIRARRKPIIKVVSVPGIVQKEFASQLCFLARTKFETKERRELAINKAVDSFFRKWIRKHD